MLTGPNDEELEVMHDAMEIIRGYQNIGKSQSDVRKGSTNYIQRRPERAQGRLGKSEVEKGCGCQRSQRGPEGAQEELTKSERTKGRSIEPTNSKRAEERLGGQQNEGWQLLSPALMSYLQPSLTSLAFLCYLWLSLI